MASTFGTTSPKHDYCPWGRGDRWPNDAGGSPDVYPASGLWSAGTRGAAAAHGRLQWGWTMTKILLAEDDTDMRRFLVKALQNAGFDVISYDNGLSAYQRLREEPFELLLTDIVMPEMDGIELARRAAELDPDIKIMFITGFAAVALNSDFDRAEARQGAVQAVPSARARQRGAEDAGGRLSAAAYPRPAALPRREGADMTGPAIEQGPGA